MINRVLIRIKVVQMLYSYLLTEKQFTLESQPTPPTKEKRFAYRLYLDMLTLMSDIATNVERNGYKPLLENRFIKMVIADDKVKSTIAKNSIEQSPYAGVIDALAKKVKDSASFKNYIKNNSGNLNDDLKVWQEIFDTILMTDVSLQTSFERIENYSLRGVERMKELMAETFKNFSTSQGHITDAIKTLKFSLDKAHELYFRLLLLPVELTNLRAQQIEINRNKFIPTAEDINPNLRFVENEYIRSLCENEEFNQYISSRKLAWMPDDRIFLNKLLKDIMSSEVYQNYMDAPTTSLHDDCEFWRNIYKHIIFDNEDLIETLEEKSVFWNDDIDIIGTFVLKTVKRFEDNPNSAILAMYKDEEDSLFGSELFEAMIKNKEEYREYINEFIRKDAWDTERLAFMDVVIMLTAIAEMLNFPKIPLKVTINEYIEIAKAYSTNKSSAFINGILGSIINSLKQKGILLKED